MTGRAAAIACPVTHIYLRQFRKCSAGLGAELHLFFGGAKCTPLLPPAQERGREIQSQESGLELQAAAREVMVVSKPHANAAAALL